MRSAEQPETSGTEPDPRFTLANERTFLAWVRTSLALIAAGVAAQALAVPPRLHVVQASLGAVLVLLGILSAATCYRHWAAVQHALRHGQPLPTTRLMPTLGIGVALIGTAALILILTVK